MTEKQKGRPLHFLTPNLLTLGRMGAIPFIVVLFYLEARWALWARTGLFVLACLTDYADGYVARAYNQSSSLGRFLDPLADKLLVVLTLVMLVGFQTIQGLLLIPAIVIIAREILVPGLREIAQARSFTLQMSTLAKWKTALQMVSMTFFLMDDHSLFFEPLRLYADMGFWGVALITLWTGYHYWKDMLLSQDLST